MDVQEGLWHHDKAATGLICLGGNDGFERGRVVNRRCDRLYCEGRSGGSEGVQVIFGKRSRYRVEQEGDPDDARRDLLEQPQPLPGQGRLHIDETGDVAARPGEARDEAAADWIGGGRENDGDAARLLQHRRGGGCVLRKNEVGPQLDDFPRESLHQLHIRRRPASVDPDIAALRPAELLESLAERRDKGLSFRVALGICHQHVDPPHLLGLLRARRERPCGYTAKQRDELAPLCMTGKEHTERWRGSVHETASVATGSPQPLWTLVRE